MGQAMIKHKTVQKIPPLVDETQIFALWTLQDVKELLAKFRMQVYGFALVEAQFEMIMSFKPDFSKKVNLQALFEVLDNNHDGRIDGLQLLGGLALCCQASFEEKARFCFELYDFNLNATMSKKEMIMMLNASICGLNMLAGGGDENEPSLDILEGLVNDAFLRAGTDSMGFEPFVSWARSNRDVMAALESLNKIVAAAKGNINPEDSAADTDESGLSSDEEMHKTKRKSSLEASASGEISALAGSQQHFTGAEAITVSQWKGQIHEPTNYKMSRKDVDGPDTNLELHWAFGYRAQNCRNNLRYINADNPDTCLLVYPAASLGVVYDMQKKSQTFYQGHSNEIVCLTIHPSGQLVATGDVAAEIHIWNALTMTAVCMIKGMVKEGIQHLAFSPSGDRIASVGLDSDHTVAIYDCASGDIISSSKGISSPGNVNDIAYSTNGTELVLVGRKQIKFFTGVQTSRRAIQSQPGYIGHLGKKQTFFCVTYCYDDAIVGCAGGELYRFRAGSCIEVVQAHGIKEPVLSIYFNAAESVIVTGGKDCLIKTWDYTLKQVGAPIDMSEDLDGDGKPDTGSLDSAVISVQSLRNRVLIGTRGSDIFEACMPSNPAENHTLTRIAFGHSAGELLGLAAHPSKDSFATCGTDGTVRVWSVRSKEQTNMRQLPSGGSAVAFNPNGEILVVGMLDGTVGLMEAQHPSLRVYSTWKHASKKITDIEFSRNFVYMATACADGNIYVYKSEDKRKYRRFAVCRGHTAPVQHIDFSANSQYLQSDSLDGSLNFWDVRGNMIKSASSLRDVNWATLSCVFGWGVQGIWAPGSNYTEINTCMALPEVGDVITGDDYGRVNLFRYPSLVHGALYQSYVGHASHVTRVCFNYNRRLVISIGGRDRTALLWKHEVEEAPDSDDMGSHSESGSSDGGLHFVDPSKEVADVGPRSLLLEAVNRNHTAEELSTLLAANPPSPLGHGGSVSVVQPWKSSVVEPAGYAPTDASFGATDCDLTLSWVHGYRSSDCRNNLFYSSSGAIVFTAAAVAIVYIKASGKQRFLQGAHSDEILGIGMHPSAQIFATGEAGRNPRIVVWGSTDMRIMKRLDGGHIRGIPLLSFNTRGNLLASVGLDPSCTLVVHEWAQNVKVMSTPTDKGKVLCLGFMYDDELSVRRDVVITGGERHLKFWWSQGQNVQSQRAIWGKLKPVTIMCVASGSPAICVTGTAKGDLLVWKNFKLERNVSAEYADEKAAYIHKSPIQSIWAIPGTVDPIHSIDTVEDLAYGLESSARYVTGDKLGVVAIWRLIENQNSELSLRCVKFFNVANMQPPPLAVSVRALCERDGIVLVGTSASEIYEVAEESIPYVPVRLPSPTSAVGGGMASTKPPIVPALDLAAAQSQAAHAQLLEPVDIAARKLIAGHSLGEVWGLATHPFLNVFFSAGDDATVRCWNLTSPEMISFTQVTEKCRAMDIMPTDAVDIVVALNSGALWALKTRPFIYRDPKRENIEPDRHGDEIDFADPIKGFGGAEYKQILPKGPNQWVADVKFSFDGTYLAVGSQDTNIYIYSIKQQPWEYSLVQTLSDHMNFITHIDFGIVLNVTATKFEVFNEVTRTIQEHTRGQSAGAPVTRPVTAKDICIQTTCADHHLLFWRCDGANFSKVTSASVMRDAWWSTWTSPIGWPVQGIWPAVTDGTEIAAVARSHTWRDVPVLASVDGFGRVKLFNYPCVQPGAPDKCYRGHAHNVTNVRFSFDDSYCITVGGTDKSIFIWQTNVQDELREKQALFSLSKAPGIAGTGSASADAEESSFNPTVVEPPARDRGSGGPSPWRHVIREPSDWTDPANLGQAPNASMELRFVYGYRGWDCRNNIGYADSVYEVVYHIAGVGIVYNSQEHTQVFNTDHENSILCLAVHPDGHTVATGEFGPKAQIILWDANTGVLVRSLQYHRTGVSNLAFTASGVLLVSVGMDVDRTIAVHNVRTGAVVGAGKAGRSTDVYALAVGGDHMFVTGGKNHIKFWELPVPTHPGGELSSKHGIYNKSISARTVISAAYLGTDAVTGMSDGTVLLWKDRSNTRFVKKTLPSQPGHMGPVTAMCSMSESSSGSLGGSGGARIISGGVDGLVNVWNMQLGVVWTLDLAKSSPASSCPQIQALATKEGRVLIGTRAAEIYEVNILNPAETFRWVQGHFGEKSEVYGLATQPHSQRFVTASDDMTVRLWCAKARQQIAIAFLGVKVRAAAFSPDGTQLAVGAADGRVKVLRDDLSVTLADVSVASARVEVMTFSPDGLTLAVGAQDNYVYLLDGKSFSCRSLCVGHSSFITGIDFSADNNRLQTSSGTFELMFWMSENGREITSPSAVRDEVWATTTCPLGWGVQGAWPADFRSAVTVTTVTRSPKAALLISGDDTKEIKLFQYPCPKQESDSKTYRGHASSAARVRFTTDGKYAVSVGGIDKAVMQWEVIYGVKAKF